MERESSKECSVSFLWTNKRFCAMKLSRNSTLFSTWRIGALGLFWTNQGGEVSEDTWGTFCTLWSEKSTFLKRNFCIYKGFMDVLYIFDIIVKQKPQNVHLKLIFCRVLDWFNLSERNDLTCLMQIALTYGILNKNFQEIKLFTCHCSFITLAQKTTTRLQMVRFLQTLRRALSWIKTEVLFLYMFCIELLFIFSFITCHSRFLQCVEFKDFCSFAMYSVLFFFHNLYNTA